MNVLTLYFSDIKLSDRHQPIQFNGETVGYIRVSRRQCTDLLHGLDCARPQQREVVLNSVESGYVFPHRIPGNGG